MIKIAIIEDEPAVRKEIHILYDRSLIYRLLDGAQM